MRQGSLCGMLGASSNGCMPREGEGAVVRQGRCIALVVAFLIGCAVLLVAVGCAEVGSEAPQKEQTHSPQATASKEEARCEGTRKINVNLPARFTTNDIPGCPKGGLLLGTEGLDGLAGEKGDDEIRGLGGSDTVLAGPGNDTIYGGPGDDESFISGEAGNDIIYGGPGDDKLKGWEGEDVIYGGPGDDKLDGGPSDAVFGGPGKLLPGGGDGQRDKIYCGEGRDSYFADKEDYVDSSCEVKLPNSLRFPKEATTPVAAGGGPASGISASALADGGGPSILLPAASLLLGSGILTYAILRRG